MNNLIHSHPHQLQHRNKEAAALSDRIKQANEESYEDAWRLMGKITFNVHLNVDNHKPETVEGVTNCLKEGKEFILFSDFDNYTIFIPENRLAVQFKDGQEIGRDVTEDAHNWISRIKAAMIIYENFFIKKTQIDAQPTEVLQLR